MEAQANTAPSRVTVRGIPSPGFKVRWRAKRPWGKEPRTVEIVDRVTDPENQITPGDLRQLLDDPLHINVVAFGGANAEVETLRAEIFERDRQLAALRKEVAEAAELRERDRATANEMAGELGGRIAALTSEVDQLRAQLTQRNTPRKG